MAAADTTLSAPAREGRTRRTRSGLGRFLARRLLLMIPMLFGIVTVAFLVTHVLPGDPARSLAGSLATEESIAEIKRQYGLDGSLLQQYGEYLVNLVQLDLGTSLVTGQAVLGDLMSRLPSTLLLIGLSLALALAIGIPLGAYAGRTASRAGQMAVRGISFTLLATPEFWLALVAIYLLFFELGWFPAPTGQLGLSDVDPPNVTGAKLIDAALAGQWSTFGSAVSHAALPVLVYGLVLSAPITRLMRSATIEVMSSDFIRFGRSLGLSPLRMWRFAVRAALPPVVTFAGVLFTLLLGGAMLIETIFSWGGAAQYAAGAIGRNDYNAVQGFVLLAGLLSMLAFLVVDLLQMAIDPRQRLAGGPAGGGLLKRLSRPTAAPVGAGAAGPAASDAASAPPPVPRAPREARFATVRQTWAALAEAAADFEPRRAASSITRIATTPNPALWSGIAIVGLLLAGSFLVPLLSSHDAYTPDPAAALQSPNGTHWFGTDSTGFDIFTRVFYAPRIDLALAAAGVAIGAVVGVVLGLLIGFTRRRGLDEVAMRVVDVLQAFPVLILAIALVSLAGDSLGNVIWAIAFINAPIFLRLVRTEVLRVREHRYIEAALALGNDRPRILLRHVLPNAIGPVVVQVGVSLGYAILTIAGLAFLGVGVQAPTPEWGSMILAGRDTISTGQWWVAVFPGLLLLVAVIGFNLLAEGVERIRDIHR